MKACKGFTLIELLFAIMVIGAIVAAIAPYVQFTPPGHARNQFITKLDSLMQVAMQQSIITNKVHRLVFDIKNRQMRVEVDKTTNPQATKQFFEPLKGFMVDTQLAIPSSIEIKQFIVEGYDEMSRFVGGKTTSVWFFIVPDGMTQQVTINFLDKEFRDRKPLQFGLVLNPFTAQFKVYDDFAR